MDLHPKNVLATLLIILVIAWITLPFAIFGTKRRLDQLIAEAKKSNALLQQLIEEVKMSQITDRHKNEEEEAPRSAYISDRVRWAVPVHAQSAIPGRNRHLRKHHTFG